MKSKPGVHSSSVEFIEGLIPKGYVLDFDEALFNSSDHRKIQSNQGWHSFHIVRRDKKKVLASIFFCIKDGVAFNPLVAPFGSFELSDSITTEQLFDFISFYEKALKKLKVKNILIKGYPQHYDQDHFTMLSILLFNYGYAINNAELGACIKVDGVTFANKIDAWEKRKLKQAAQHKLTFKQIPLTELQEVYQFIHKCREERGQSLSMSLGSLSKTVTKLKNDFFCFGVYQGQTLIASSIAIKINRKILYNFYSAHSKAFDSLSPIVFLISELYLWCSHHKITLLDLGTSALGGKPNFSLVDFKLRMGAEPSMKLSFEKNLK